LRLDNYVIQIYFKSAGKSIELFKNTGINTRLLPEPFIKICFMLEAEVAQHYPAVFLSKHRFRGLCDQFVVRGENGSPFAPFVPLTDG